MREALGDRAKACDEGLWLNTSKFKVIEDFLKNLTQLTHQLRMTVYGKSAYTTSSRTRPILQNQDHPRHSTQTRTKTGAAGAVLRPWRINSRLIYLRVLSFTMYVRAGSLSRGWT